ncbi:MAG TPA: hypothetical protein VH852_00485 [Hyphomicrobium sp.]|jgi:hypothetical protein
MSKYRIGDLRYELAVTLARAELLKLQGTIRALRKDRASKRRKGGTCRLGKELRAFKSLLPAMEPQLAEKPSRRRALTKWAQRSTTC